MILAAATGVHAFWVLITILCVMAIAYRYYSAFLAAKVAVLDDSIVTPAIRNDDGQNFHPTSKWVLFGHHFAAISGAGPLIGPVLAAQFGYLPGLLWIVIGVCLGGAVQDFLVLAMSTRRGGKSLAQIAYGDIGKVAGTAATIAILFIIIISLAGLGKVIVKALGGEEVKYPALSSLVIPPGVGDVAFRSKDTNYVPAGAMLVFGPNRSMTFTSGFLLRSPKGLLEMPLKDRPLSADGSIPSEARWYVLPEGAVRLVPGSAWGTFTIACTIPIALFVGFYMYRLRKGKTVEASLIGGALTIGATIAGAFIAGSPLERFFTLSDQGVVIAMAIYGFFAAVLPVWVLLAPRDYLSSFLKIGTIALLIGGTLIANPELKAPAFNGVFSGGGPVVNGKVFPFLFITIMCGAISGFHSLVSSGTTPKMVMKESHTRTIGYGAMLMEALVGVVAMIAASTLDPGDYYAMNTDMAKVPAWHDSFVKMGAGIDHLNVYDDLTQESLRGRTGGAVTLAVGMAHIFDQAFGKMWHGMNSMWKYWYHFAIMFEALFILTTIDAGTRIGRFLLQEVAGKIHPSLGRPGWVPGALISTLLIVVGWCYFINANSFAAIWSMFGICNQMLAVIALAVVSAYLANEGRSAYLWVTGGPLIVVATTTSTAAVQLLLRHVETIKTQLASAAPNQALMTASIISGSLILGMLICAYTVIISSAIKCYVALGATGRPGASLRSAPGVVAKM